MTRLFVIPGHGAGDPGACGHGYSEAERVRALAQRIKDFGGDSVTLADFSRNYYADNGISRLDLPADVEIVELHMDSGPAGARGGHVIAYPGTVDAHDRGLAALMARVFPGRANLVAERADLANPARARGRGFGYRLVENGFVSDAGDVEAFNARIDELAQGYLDAFGIRHEEGDGVQRISNDGGDIYRLYNPNSKTAAHHYTASAEERDGLARAGWKYEGVAFVARPNQRRAVYRMYSPGNGDHVLTADFDEAAGLQKAGWKYEGVPFFASDDGAEVHRLYNPDSGEHFYTASGAEASDLEDAGWRREGVAFRV